MDNIDVNVPMYMNLWLFHVAFVVATIVLISYSTPIFLVLFVPLTVIFLVVQVSYRPTVTHGRNYSLRSLSTQQSHT